MERTQSSDVIIITAFLRIRVQRHGIYSLTVIKYEDRQESFIEHDMIKYNHLQQYLKGRAVWHMCAHTHALTHIHRHTHADTQAHI